GKGQDPALAPCRACVSNTCSTLARPSDTRRDSAREAGLARRATVRTADEKGARARQTGRGIPPSAPARPVAPGVLDARHVGRDPGAPALPDTLAKEPPWDGASSRSCPSP